MFSLPCYRRQATGEETMRLGAHVSTAGGLDKAIDRAKEMGCETVQIFGSPPQSWAFKPAPDEQVEAFRRKAKEADIHPVYFHAIYLINLGTPNEANLEKSVQALVNYMALAARVEAEGVIFHPGSHGGAGYAGIFQQTVGAIRQVLSKSPQGPYLVLENTAGMGQHIGAGFEELGGILKSVASPRLKVCLDTQHCFAAGYNVADKKGLKQAMEEFNREVGLKNLVAVHANDSKQPFGSGVDRHENIGDGHIGEEGFANIMSHPAFKDVPFFLEVPGADGKGPDKPNLDRLKRIRAKLGIKP
jgi:deoxyribonuclease-4